MAERKPIAERSIRNPRGLKLEKVMAATTPATTPPVVAPEIALGKTDGGERDGVRRRRRPAIALVLFVMLGAMLAGCTTTTPTGERVRVQRVVDGALVEVVGANGVEPVQLLGVNAPSLEQSPWGEAARQALADRLTGQPVLLEGESLGAAFEASDRRWGYLWLEGELVNQMAIASGGAIVAKHPTFFKYRTRLEHAEDRARLLGLGVWNPERPLRSLPEERP